MSIHASMERERILDYRTGLIVSTLINLAPKKHKTRTYEPKDFFPSLKPSRVQTPTQQRNALSAIALVSGATIIRVPAAELEAMSGN